MARTLQADFRKILEYSVEAVEAALRSCRALFGNVQSVADHIHKVAFWNRESREASARFQRAVFAQQKLSLSAKMHLRSFARQVDRIADDAEALANRMNLCVARRASYGLAMERDGR